MSVDETLRKEAWEEAGIPPALLQDLNCAGAVRVEYSVPEGLHREILFVHDLWLPHDFKPVNQDGEVAEIRRMLGGEGTDAADLHARELLKAA
jgi:8-oxo-dGTP pyrophosphatase MutT (NUDIX family)